MAYQVVFTPQAERSFSKLPLDAARRLRHAAYALADDPRPAGCKKLKGRLGWRIAAGRYRLIYAIEDDRLIVTVLKAGPRKDVYRD